MSGPDLIAYEEICVENIFLLSRRWEFNGCIKALIERINTVKLVYYILLSSFLVSPIWKKKHLKIILEIIFSKYIPNHKARLTDGAANLPLPPGGQAGRPEWSYLLVINKFYAMLLEFILLDQVDTRGNWHKLTIINKYISLTGSWLEPRYWNKNDRTFAAKIQLSRKVSEIWYKMP